MTGAGGGTGTGGTAAGGAAAGGAAGTSTKAVSRVDMGAGAGALALGGGAADKRRRGAGAGATVNRRLSSGPVSLETGAVLGGNWTGGLATGLFCKNCPGTVNRGPSSSSTLISTLTLGSRDR